MRVEPTELAEVLAIAPDVHGDERGFFLETFAAERYAQHGVGPFVQDNLSRSSRGVLRGLHLQHPTGQGKLVMVIEGQVFDVAVDVRVGSPTFGKWTGAWLDGARKNQLWVPPGFAHGFCVTSEHALFFYKCTAPYAPAHELGVAWNDPDLAIAWPVSEPRVSPRDAAHPRLRDVARDRLPPFP